MLSLDSSAVDCFIYTFKHGLLSGVTHDLKLRATDLKIEIREERGSADNPKCEMSARATLKAAAIRCVTAMKHGVEVPGVLSAKDYAEIEKNMARHVLKTKYYPEIVFALGKFRDGAKKPTMEGALTLCGVTRDVSLTCKKTHDAVFSEFVIHQPDFGIKPCNDPPAEPEAFRLLAPQRGHFATDLKTANRIQKPWILARLARTAILMRLRQGVTE